ncbi:MAG TPA: sulfurtransferase [Candidatus Bathyarchaeia archaeon]|nr:sulfurtransferase [Candidatus Bathyarchaeia archaeon]
MQLVISSRRLRELLHDKLQKKHLLLIDTRPYPDYIKGHIPGAVNLDFMQFHWIDSSKQGIKQFDRQMRLLLSNIGITKDKFVVFYDDISGSSSARGVWLLLYFSHKRTALLDGGFQAWKNTENETETKTNPFIHSNFRCLPNPKILADIRQVRSAIKKTKTVTLVDARSKSEYQGSVVRASRAGHIPSAVNIDWMNNVDDKGFFKDPERLRHIYSDINRNTEIITYCQGGYRAANTFVVLKSLGYRNVKMYLGSWGEWGNRLDVAVQL